MALTPTASASGSTARTQFTVASSSAGSGGTVYTVPEGKSFTGYFYMQYPSNNSYVRIVVNGNQIFVGSNSTYGTWYAFPIYLSSGDVVANVGTEYFNLTGYEE